MAVASRLPDPRELQRRRRDLWESVNAFVRSRAASITSLPHVFPCVVEAVPGSPIAFDLEAMGFIVKPTGTVTRIDPVGKVEVIAGARSSSPPLRTLHHAAIRDDIECFEVSPSSRMT
jgi:hypothetical protein